MHARTHTYTYLPKCDQNSSIGSSGFLVPTVAPASHAARHVVVLLEGLEKASSLTCLLGDFCHSLDTRDPSSPLLLHTGTIEEGRSSGRTFVVTPRVVPGPHHFCEGSFLIATLSKPRLQGSELRLQQHFRWVTLRWDQEPLHGLLGRQLRRKLLHKVRGCSPPARSQYW